MRRRGDVIAGLGVAAHSHFVLCKLESADIHFDVAQGELFDDGLPSLRNGGEREKLRRGLVAPFVLVDEDLKDITDELDGQVWSGHAGFAGLNGVGS